MKSVIRPTRGRPSKVTKSAPSPGRGGRQPPPRHPTAHLHEALAAAAAAASLDHPDQLDHGDHGEHEHDHEIKADHSVDSIDPTAHHAHVFDDSRIGAEDYAAAAAAATMAMETGLTGDVHGEAEADADMEEDDPSTNASGLPQVDLTTAADILANGGAGNNAQPSPQDHQQVDLQQALPQAHQHQQQQTHQHQQPQAQMGHTMEVRTTEDLARESGYTDLNVESALAKRLAREPGHRHAHQRRPEQVLNLARRSNVEALFAHIAGETARVPCKNCHKGHGPWTSCVIVDGQMCGSCANCWFNASGARCSFHETRNPQAVSQHPSIMPSTSAGLPPDAGYRTFAPPHGLLPSAPNPQMGGMPHTGLLTNNPVLQHMVNKAMVEVRQADKANRQLILIDITAKQLALQIVEYEEMTNQESSGGQGPGQQIMGDDGGA